MAPKRPVTIANRTGLSVGVTDRGRFDIVDRARGWNFTGQIGGPATDLTANRKHDRAGTFQETSFAFTGLKGAARRGAIRLYDRRNVILFEKNFIDPGTAAEAFPSLSTYPRKLHHLAYTGIFGRHSFTRFGTDGPWVFFDDRRNAFILSAASHFMNASLTMGSHGELRGGLVADAPLIPAGFTHTTVLAIASGINSAFETWGQFLTDLGGKRRPAYDADVGLKYLGYWTDHGARYYYRTVPGQDYTTTLVNVRDEFRRVGVGLGYMQLDSWFYRKGFKDQWRAVTEGTYLYEASPELFPDGLRGLQKALRLPLVTHNRWLDKRSPYRKKYAVSGNVSIDPALWRRWMRYLKGGGVRIYEQDWLSGPALPERTLTAGERFMDAMAAAARHEGMTMQYCMPLPRHFLQSTNYSNLTTIRPSGDRLKEQHWRSFLFNGRLATALGIWPWTDVFKSSETANLLLATLSGGMVGVGDAIGKIDGQSLLRAVRRDGVIVKPDRPLTPVDQSYIAQARDRSSPVIAAASTDHGGLVTSYVFAFGARSASVSPASLGHEGPVYAYDYFRRSGIYLTPDQSIRMTILDRIAYWIVAPVSASGIGFLGDAGKFVSNGRQRVASVADTGVLTARIAFTKGEDRVRLHGFSGRRPEARARGGTIENMSYDARRRLFRLDLVARPGTSATLRVLPR